MLFQLTEADLTTDWKDLVVCMWKSHEDPFQPFLRLFCPILDNNREASIQESADRFLEWHLQDPHARWLKVTDTSTGKIVGGAWYKIYKESPFENPQEEIAYWNPSDSTRDYASQALEAMEKPRKQKGNTPQVFLNILFTHPGYRRKSIGAMLLEWGVDVARDMKVDFWLDATPIGKPLYEKYGFHLVERNPLVLKTSHPDEKWEKIKREMSEIVFWTMVLPYKRSK